MLEFMNGLADVETYVALSLAVIFTIAYAGFFHWRKTRAGRAIFYLFLSWVILTSVSLVTMWMGPHYVFRPLWRVLAWSFVVFTLVNLLYVLGRSFLKHEHPLANVQPRHTEELPIVKKEDDRGE